MTAATIDEALAFVEPCNFPIEAEWDEGCLSLTRCGEPAVDDEDEPRCAEHLGATLDGPR